MKQKKEYVKHRWTKRDFVTFAMITLKHSVAYRPKLREKLKTNQEKKEPRKLGQPDTTIHTRTEGTTVQLCGDSSEPEKWINGHYALGWKFQTTIGRFQKTLHSWWRKKTAYPVAQIDDFVKHIFREHNQEADHLANLGTSGQRKITIDGVKNTEGWKAVRASRTTAEKDNGQSGCGVVIKEVDHHQQYH